MIHRVERFADGLDALDTEVSQGLLELLDDTLDTFDVLVVFEFFRHVLERALEVIDDRQQVAHDVSFDDVS